MMRPLAEPVNITGDRASHAAYNVGPATDYGCDIGTPVLAPFTGRMSTYVTSAGGLGVIVVGADATFYGQHLWVRMTPGTYAEGERIALSGNSGTQTTGPHLHCYVIVHATGERLAMEEYLALAAALDARPFTPPPIEEIDMATAVLIRATGARNGMYLAAPGHFHQFTEEEWGWFKNQQLLAEGLRVVDVGDNPRALDLARGIYAP